MLQETLCRFQNWPPGARDPEVAGVLGCRTSGLRDGGSFLDVAVSEETERQRAGHHPYGDCHSTVSRLFSATGM